MIREKKLTQEEMQIIKLWESGYSGAQIGIELNLTRNTVMGKIYRLRKWGLMSYGHDLMKGRPDIKVALPKETPKKTKIPFKPIAGWRKRNPWAPLRDPAVVNYEGESVSFNDLKPGMCRFSTSGETPATYRFCCEPAVKMSYCAHHYGICFLPYKPKSKPDNENNYTIKRGR